MTSAGDERRGQRRDRRDRRQRRSLPAAAGRGGGDGVAVGVRLDGDEDRPVRHGDPQDKAHDQCGPNPRPAPGSFGPQIGTLVPVWRLTPAPRGAGIGSFGRWLPSAGARWLPRRAACRPRTRENQKGLDAVAGRGYERPPGPKGARSGSMRSPRPFGASREAPCQLVYPSARPDASVCRDFRRVPEDGRWRPRPAAAPGARPSTSVRFAVIRVAVRRRSLSSPKTWANRVGGRRGYSAPPIRRKPRQNLGLVSPADSAGSAGGEAATPSSGSGPLARGPTGRASAGHRNAAGALGSNTAVELPSCLGVRWISGPSSIWLTSPGENDPGRYAGERCRAEHDRDDGFRRRDRLCRPGAGHSVRGRSACAAHRRGSGAGRATAHRPRMG